MESAAADHQTGGDVRDTGSLDLSSMSIADLFSHVGSDTPLAHALRRVVDPDTTEVLTAFDSFADDAGQE